MIAGDAEHPGESAEQVGERTDRVLARVQPLLAAATSSWSPTATCCACSPPAGWGWSRRTGKLFRLDTGTVSTLGDEHGHSVIAAWNIPPRRTAGTA